MEVESHISSLLVLLTEQKSKINLLNCRLRQSHKQTLSHQATLELLTEKSQISFPPERSPTEEPHPQFLMLMMKTLGTDVLS